MSLWLLFILQILDMSNKTELAVYNPSKTYLEKLVRIQRLNAEHDLQLSDGIDAITQMNLPNDSRDFKINDLTQRLRNNLNAEISKIDNTGTINRPVSFDITEMSYYSPSIKEIINTEYTIKNGNQIVKVTGEKPIKIQILKIAFKYLRSNMQGRNLANDTSVNLIVEYITQTCGNLELPEIEFIFKNGVSGIFSTIYNNISVDTIIGKDGWIDTYYSKFRNKRPDPNQYVELDLMTKEKFLELYPKYKGMSLTELIEAAKLEGHNLHLSSDEFLEINPEIKLKNELTEILNKAKDFNIKWNDVKKFYKLKGYHCPDEYQKDAAVYCKAYHNLENQIKKVSDEILDLNIRIEEYEIKGFLNEKFEAQSLKREKTILKSNYESLKLLGEDRYILEFHRRFIIDNIYKVKK